MFNKTSIELVVFRGKQAMTYANIAFMREEQVGILVIFVHCCLLSIIILWI